MLALVLVNFVADYSASNFSDKLIFTTVSFGVAALLSKGTTRVVRAF